MTARTVVLKLGGSVLRDLRAYHAHAVLLRDRLAADPAVRVVAVVSAQHGETDALLALAREITPAANGAALDLLWSTGEVRSAAMLALCLQRAGVAAAALGVHQSGVWRAPDRPPACVRVDPAPLRRALARHSVVVVPGFLATERGGAIVSLGRGGSDLSAVAIAAALGAHRCELMKDVPGYFTADPNHDAGAEHLPAIDYGRALRMARAGCDLVQEAALESARRAGLALVIRSATDVRHTLVTEEHDGIRHENDSRRAAVGA
jgi:aspartate kinase